MDRKKRRTMDVYKKVGAEMRLAKTMVSKLWVDSSAVLRKPDSDRLLRALNIIKEVSDQAENNMFSDYPDLPRDYTRVFSGPTDSAYTSGALDEEIIALAKGVADSCCCPKGEPEDGSA